MMNIPDIYVTILFFPRGKDELAKKMAQISLQDSDDNSENENVKPKLKQPQQQQQNVKV